MPTAPLMLGVSGLRGILGASFTPDVARRFARAFAASLRPDSAVLVAADGRNGYRPIARAATDALADAGLHVLDAGVAPTPTAAVAAAARNARAALVVTASHNPQEWLGLKCLIAPHGGTLYAPPPESAQPVINAFHADRRPSPARRAPVTPVSDACDVHARRVLDALRAIAPDAGTLRGLRVVVDSVNASGAPLVHAFFGLLDAPFDQIAGDGSGVFPHPPEPLADHLGTLCDAVRSRGAHVGFAQDPDADRLAIVDEQGRYIGEEYTLVLAARSLLEAFPHTPGRRRALVANLSTSRMIDDLARAHDARVHRTPVGEAHVARAVRRLAADGWDVVIAGEGNGGVIWPAVGLVRDSLSAIALTLALVARTGLPVSRLVADLPSYAIRKRKAPLASKADAEPALDALADHFAHARVDRSDGVRIDLDDRRAWIHVRPSNTEPILRLIAEAPSPELADSLLDQAHRCVAAQR